MSIPGHVPTPEQLTALNDFKLAHPDFFSESDAELTIDDEKLFRFLTARDFDFSKCAKMLEYDRDFRSKWRPGTITQESEGVLVFLNSGCWRVMGSGTKNQPVIWCRVGLWNPHE